MVGWKINAAKVGLDIRDLQIVADELVRHKRSPDHQAFDVVVKTDAKVAGGPTTAVADGSYFTDYVHHIAISIPGFSPRAVTRDLLVRLIRPAQMMALVQSYGGESPTVTDAQH